MAHLNHNILPRKSNPMSSFENGQRRVFFNDSILIAETPSDMAKAESSVYEPHVIAERRGKSS